MGDKKERSFYFIGRRSEALPLAFFGGRRFVPLAAGGAGLLGAIALGFVLSLGLFAFSGDKPLEANFNWLSVGDLHVAFGLLLDPLSKLMLLVVTGVLTTLAAWRTASLAVPAFAWLTWARLRLEERALTTRFGDDVSLSNHSRRQHRNDGHRVEQGNRHGEDDDQSKLREGLSCLSLN